MTRRRPNPAARGEEDVVVVAAVGVGAAPFSPAPTSSQPRASRKLATMPCKGCYTPSGHKLLLSIISL